MTHAQSALASASPGDVTGRAVPLAGRVVPVAGLDDGARAAMYGLLTAHFSGVAREVFDADLAEKGWAILLEDDGDRLRGFSTLAVYESCAGGRPATIVYSGDTIVHREWWGSPALARTWIRAVRRLSGADRGAEVYWFLLTSGHRTYRFLPVFFRTFHPRHDGGADPVTAALLDAVARERFGGRYDSTCGIVRFARPQMLTPELVALPAKRALDPHVAFFLARNPGHANGDELACLTRIHDDNLTPAGRRMLGSEAVADA